MSVRKHRITNLLTRNLQPFVVVARDPVVAGAANSKAPTLNRQVEEREKLSESVAKSKRVLRAVLTLVFESCVLT